MRTALLSAERSDSVGISLNDPVVMDSEVTSNPNARVHLLRTAMPEGLWARGSQTSDPSASAGQLLRTKTPSHVSKSNSWGLRCDLLFSQVPRCCCCCRCWPRDHTLRSTAPGFGEEGADGLWSIKTSQLCRYCRTVF